MSRATPPPLADAAEIGTLGIRHLKRFWSRCIATREGASPGPNHEWSEDRLVLDALRLPIEMAIKYVYGEAPTFAAFEAYVRETCGEPSADVIARVDAALRDEAPPAVWQGHMRAVDTAPDVLSADDLACFDAYGYVVLREAISREAAEESARLVRRAIGATEDEATWLCLDRSIDVPFFKDARIDENRETVRVRKAFAQLYGTSDLWASSDRTTFHRPEKPEDQLVGLGLDWHMSLGAEMPLEIAGALYLTDVGDYQGGLACVPGFHRRLATWLASLPKGQSPRDQDLLALGAEQIPGKAGDLVLWHPAVPTGRAPNRGATPTITQKLSLRPFVRTPEAPWL